MYKVTSDGHYADVLLWLDCWNLCFLVVVIIIAEGNRILMVWEYFTNAITSHFSMLLCLVSLLKSWMTTIHARSTIGIAVKLVFSVSLR